MTGRRVRERPSLTWFSYAGLGLFTLSCAVTTLLAPGALNYSVSATFLALCLPRLGVGARALTARGPDEWELHGRDGMARVGSHRVSSTDEVGNPYYTAEGSLRPGGKRLFIEAFQYPVEHEDTMRAMEALPVSYLPTTGRVRIRTDLVRMVLDCEDPLTRSPASPPNRTGP